MVSARHAALVRLLWLCAAVGATGCELIAGIGDRVLAPDASATGGAGGSGQGGGSATDAGNDRAAGTGGGAGPTTGTGGHVTGTGGATPGTGGSTTGAGGSTLGTGGSTLGTGGSATGTGGSTTGTGGSTTGTGGHVTGTGGATPGTGGSPTGTGGSPSNPGNLIKNGDFSLGNEYWDLTYQAGEVAASDASGNMYCIENISDTFYLSFSLEYPMTLSDAFVIDPSAGYTLTYKASATYETLPATVEVKIGHVATPYTELYSATDTVSSTAYPTFSHQVTSPAGDTAAGLVFNGTLDYLSQICFENVSLTKN